MYCEICEICEISPNVFFPCSSNMLHEKLSYFRVMHALCKVKVLSMKCLRNMRPFQFTKSLLSGINIVKYIQYILENEANKPNAFFEFQTEHNTVRCTHVLYNVPHRVGRVLSFSQVVGIGTPPTPHPQRSISPRPQVLGEGHTRWRERGWESPNSDEGTYTVVLFIYAYFVMYRILLLRKV